MSWVISWYCMGLAFMVRFDGRLMGLMDGCGLLDDYSQVVSAVLLVFSLLLNMVGLGVHCLLVCIKFLLRLQSTGTCLLLYMLL